MGMIFEKREQAFENKFAYEQESNFRIRVRAVKRLGRWVAEAMNLEPQEGEIYAFELADFNLATPHFDAMINKIHDDLCRAEIDISLHSIQREFEEKIMEARAYFMEPAERA